MKKVNISSPKNSNAKGVILEDISPSSIARDVARQIVLILLCATIAFAGFFVAKNESYKPQYISSATLMVSTKDNSADAFSNLSKTTQVNQVFKLIIESNALLDKVNRDLNRDASKAKINAKMLEGTNLLELSVTASSPKDSYDVLCSIIRCYPVFMSEITENVIYVFDEPSVPTHDNGSSNVIIFGVLGFFAGALACIGVLVYLSITKQTIKDYNQVNNKLTARLLASVPNEKNQSSYPLVSNTIVSFEFKEAFNELRSKINRENKSKNAKCFAISSTTDNEGKTTASINLAVSLARQGYKVILIDLDYNAPSIHKALGIEVDEVKDFQRCFYGYEVEELSPFIFSDKINNIDMLLSSIGYVDVERAIVRERLEKIISNLKESYDYIIIDTASVDRVATVDDVINACDEVIIVVREDFERAEKINDSIDILSRTGKTVAGTIFNFSSIKKGYAYGYAYYGGYHNKYGYKYNSYNKYSKKNSPSSK